MEARSREFALDEEPANRIVQLPHQLKYRLASGVGLEDLPDCTLLFSEPDQLLHRLNGSSAAIARRLTAGATLGELEKTLSNEGVNPATATEWVSTFLHEMTSLALLSVELPLPSDRPATTEQYRIAGMNFAVRYDSDELIELVGAAFAHLRSEPANDGHSYRLSTVGEWVLFGRDSEPPRLLAKTAVAVRLKAAILEDVLNGGSHVAALHAACLARRDGTLLLLGPPGAGKSTTSLALMQRGFRLGSDDVTLVTREGAALGVTMPPGVKESAWPVAEQLGISVSKLPTHVRPDGSRVRFLPLDGERLEGPSRIQTIVRLNRRAGAELAMNPLPSDEALRTMFRGSRSPSGRCSTEIMHLFAQILGQANCFDLHYGEAADAAGLLADYDHA